MAPSLLLSRSSSNVDGTGTGVGASEERSDARPDPADVLADLLRAHPALTEHGMTTTTTTTTDVPSSDRRKDEEVEDEEDDPSARAAFSYAAALLEASDAADVRVRAREALDVVERLAASVEAVHASAARDRPEEVSRALRRLHVADDDDEEEEEGGDTLASLRGRCGRLARQTRTLESVADRVESSLSRGLSRMDAATRRLRRVLECSALLKTAMRLRFEARKVESSGVLEQLARAANDGEDAVDLRDLTRAAASVASMERLLRPPETEDGSLVARSTATTPLEVVERTRPRAEEVAAAVRAAAASLLKEGRGNSNNISNNNNARYVNSTVRLGATLQVYFHLDELPQAAWGAVADGLAAAEKAAAAFFNPAAVQRLPDDRRARAEAARAWAAAVGEASLRVWNLQRVLRCKVDPVSRVRFADVVARAPVPDEHVEAAAYADADAAATTSSDPRGRRRRRNFSLFTAYWYRACVALGARTRRLLRYDDGASARRAAVLYPAVRAAALDMLVGLRDRTRDRASEPRDADAPTAGLLGGRRGATWDDRDDDDPEDDDGAAAAGADAWTRDAASADDDDDDDARTTVGPSSSSSSSAVISGPEWRALEGTTAVGEDADADDAVGLAPLRRAFLESSSERLLTPLTFLFADNADADADADAATKPSVHLPTLPSKYDVLRLDECVRKELALCDPRAGGGELGMVRMMCDNVSDMVARFCRAADGAFARGRSDDDDDGGARYLEDDGVAPTEALLHDRRLAAVLASLADHVSRAPERVLVAPYRPAAPPEHEEAARACRQHLRPALREIRALAGRRVLDPLCRELRDRATAAAGTMHDAGVYSDAKAASPDDDDDPASSPGLVRDALAPLYEEIAARHLRGADDGDDDAALPPEYAAVVARSVAERSVAAFVSNLALVRPLGEAGRLAAARDSADLELALEQLVGGVDGLDAVDGGRVRAELRAVRPMLFSDLRGTADEAARALARENWIKDARPSTVCHHLFSLPGTPDTLSSPHHRDGARAEDYARQLIDGTTADAETAAWMTTAACCDEWRQRESVTSNNNDDDDDDVDRRVPAVLMTLGPELLRRRRQ